MTALGLGIMLDRVILEAFHQYLGQPSPVMRPYIGSIHYIRRMGCETKVDEHGDISARSCLQGGNGMRAYEFATTVEPHNIFDGKVPADCIQRYINLHQR